jgi:hypothetical protein
MTMIDGDDATADVTVGESATREDTAMAGLSVSMLVAVHLDGRAHFRDLPDSIARGGASAGSR